MARFFPEKVGKSLERIVAIAGLSAALAIWGACVDHQGEKGWVEAKPDAELVAQFRSEAVRWIRAERERYRPLGLPLPEEDRLSLAPYFPEELLRRARVVVIEGFDNPEFFVIFEEHGEPIPVDLRRASGLALVDTILVTRTASESSRRDRLLFHELVHLMQYQILGLDEYMNSYVESWAGNGRRYRSIPHEAQAFELAGRFAAGGKPFSVEQEVRACFVSEISL